jgi:CheY-like chemotaxis protein
LAKPLLHFRDKTDTSTAIQSMITTTSPTAKLNFPGKWRVFPIIGRKEGECPAAPRAADQTSILIADDSAVCRQMLRLHLERAGYHVIAAADGEAAMDELRKPTAPAVAILDWLMPGLDGPAICQRVRDTDRAIYLILLTSLDRDKNVVAGLNAGADEYLAKPFTPHELLARVKVGERLIGAQRALAEKIAKLERSNPSRPPTLRLSVL